jgi:hypothetical protein
VTTLYIATKILHQSPDKSLLHLLTSSSTKDHLMCPQILINNASTSSSPYAQAQSRSHSNLHSKNPTPPTSISTPKAKKISILLELQVLHKNKMQQNKMQQINNTTQKPNQDISKSKPHTMHPTITPSRRKILTMLHINLTSPPITSNT